MTRTITAMYDTRQEAETARAQLAASGIDSGSIQITGQDGGGSQASSSGSGSGGGFFQGLKDFFMPDDDRQAYSEGIRRGHYVLTVQAEETRADEICRMLDTTGAVDFDARLDEWRTGGWTAQPQMATGQTQESIPVVEEQLRVGKREVERGGVRVRSYVAETPVQEQVSLREEHVEVERRPVNEAVRGADADNLFQERSIELSERGEEAVVAKEAVVREEIGIRKDVDQRVETISDTVRHTEVDIDDGRSRIGERASFADQDGMSDGSGTLETEEERRLRQQREGGTTQPRF